jgi:tetratricopeptide (TPR) repeat protein
MVFGVEYYADSRPDHRRHWLCDRYGVLLRPVLLAHDTPLGVEIHRRSVALSLRVVAGRNYLDEKGRAGMGLRKGRRAATDSGLIAFEEVEAYREAGRLDEAIPALERTLSYYVRNIGPRDPDTVTVRMYLAVGYEELDRIPEAIDLFESALADTEAAFG